MIDRKLESAVNAGRNRKEASAVAKIIGAALIARRPRSGYLFGRDALLLAAMAMLPNRPIDRMLLKD